MGIRPIEGKKILEYLVDKFRTWITEDQLRISLSPMLVAKRIPVLQGSFVA
jgi:hypothetical protein